LGSQDEVQLISPLLLLYSDNHSQIKTG